MGLGREPGTAAERRGPKQISPITSWTRRRCFALAAAPCAPRVLFTGRGATGFLNPDRRLEIIGVSKTKPQVLRLQGAGQGAGQSGWGFYGTFRDGRLLLMSLELPADWRTRPFDDYYPRSRTRIWRAHATTGALEELCARDRVSSFYAPCCVLPDGRLAVTAIVNGKSILYTMEPDGSDARAITGEAEFVYGVSLSPDGQWFAFHANYRIHVCRVDGRARREVAAERGMLYFGSAWSPRGDWVLFQACDPRADPAHDWSRIGVARPDGSDLRWLTPPASAWFGASYGPRTNPGGGSNQPLWAGERVLYVRRIPDAATPWQFQANRRDTDHFNRDYRPELARGGAHLSVHDPATGEEEFVTPPRPGVWDFRPAFSPQSGVAFCRARVGRDPELWLALAGRLRRLTSGVRGHGVEHPAWLPGNC